MRRADYESIVESWRCARRRDRDRRYHVAGRKSRRRINGAREADVLEGGRADSPGELSVVPRAGFNRADVADHIRRGASVGEVYSPEGVHAPDAAVAHRQGHW